MKGYVEIGTPLTFNSAVKRANERYGSYGLAPSFDFETLERHINASFEGGSALIYETKATLVNLYPYELPYYFKDIDTYIYQSKVFTKPIDFKLLDHEGNKVNKADIPKEVFFVRKGDRLFTLEETNGKLTYSEDEGFNLADSTTINVVDRAIRKKSLENFKTITKESSLKHALTGVINYQAAIDAITSSHKNKYMGFSNLTRLLEREGFLAVLEKYPEITDLFLKLNGYIHVSSEDKRELRKQLKGSYVPYGIESAYRSAVQAYLNRREPKQVKYLEMIYD